MYGPAQEENSGADVVWLWSSPEREADSGEVQGLEETPNPVIWDIRHQEEPTHISVAEATEIVSTLYVLMGRASKYISKYKLTYCITV